MFQARKKMGVLILTLVFVIFAATTALANTFTNKMIYGKKWTVITTGSTGSTGKIYGTITKINDTSDKNAGYDKVLVTGFQNNVQQAADVVAEKGKAFMINIGANKANVAFEIKGHTASLDAIVSGDVSYN